MAIEIPGLGLVVLSPALGGYVSVPTSVPALGPAWRTFVLAGYDDDRKKEDFHEAIHNFRTLSQQALTETEPYLVKYLNDCNQNWTTDDEEYIALQSSAHVWNHVQLGTEPVVSRRHRGDNKVYVSLECGCDWEPEHGLQLVFRDGNHICKVGAYDGHLTNADAYARPELENVVYREV